MNAQHDRELLGAYTLGVLDEAETRTVDAHLTTCAECRAELAELAALRDDLGEVPPEAFLDGPPEGGDLLLQRTLRRVRGERSRTGRQRTALAAASVVVFAAAALGGGVLIGRSSVSTVDSQPTGVVQLAGSNAQTGAAMTVRVVPAAGWVRVHAEVTGVAAGTRCQLVVRDRNGVATVAGSWLVSAKGEAEGTTVDGAALVPLDQVSSVDVLTLDGQPVVSATA